jgi:hypothetical protein
LGQTGTGGAIKLHGKSALHPLLTMRRQALKGCDTGDHAPRQRKPGKSRAAWNKNCMVAFQKPMPGYVESFHACTTLPQTP